MTVVVDMPPFPVGMLRFSNVMWTSHLEAV
jgi:hypothetical protein